MPTSDRLNDLRTMTRRDLEALRADIDKALVICIVCGEAGGAPFYARYGNREGTLDICPACFAKHRRMPSRSRLRGDT